MSLDSGQLHPQIIITPSTIQQEKAPVVSIEAAEQAGDAAAAAGVEAGVAGLAVAAVTSDVGLKRDQQSPCSVEEDLGPTSADLVISSTSASTYGKVRELFFSCLEFLFCILFWYVFLKKIFKVLQLTACSIFCLLSG